MNILITGGAGYKGVVLTAKLLELGYKITVLDNFMYGPEPLIHLSKNPKLKIVKADIMNKISNLKKYDIIIHLAGISGLPACIANPSSAEMKNVDATKLLVKSLSPGICICWGKRPLVAIILPIDLKAVVKNSFSYPNLLF